MALLEVDDLHTDITLRHGVVHALGGVSFEVGSGETLGIVGESGCGKTMTGLSIMRLLPHGGRITGGRIRLEGEDLVGRTDEEMREVRGNRVGMVFQDPMTSLNPTMTVGAQIAEAVLLHRPVSRVAAMARAAEVLDLVGMPRPAERLGDYPHQLSGGMRQRVMIAMALACEPQLLIADEPTTALDVTIQKQILDLIDDLRERLGMTVILITHDLGVIAGRADRVVVMYAGRVAESAPTAGLFARPRHRYTEALFEALPEKSAATRHRLYNIPGLPPDLSLPLVGCRFAPRCRHTTPDCLDREPVLGYGAAGHLFACFHPAEGEAREAPRGDGAGDGAGDGEDGAGATATGTGGPLVAGPVAAGATVTGTGGPPVAAGATATGTGGPPVAGPVAAGPVTAGPAGDRQAGGRGGEPPAAGPPALVEVRDLRKDFAVTSGLVIQRKVGTVSAVAGVSFDIRAGETFGLVGESGCGKTTIGRMVVALEKPTSGQVRFGGADLTTLRGGELRRRRRQFQLIFQDPYASLDPRMRVGAILREPLAIQAMGSRAAQQRMVAALLRDVGLSAGAEDRYAHEFSGGQRQRIGLARALALRPALIVADEPVSALDVSIQAQILNLMRELQREHELTYLFISHDLSVVRYMSDTIGVMYLGKLVEVGPADDVYQRPAHPYTSGLVATIPVADPAAHRGGGRSGVRGELPSAINPPSGCRFRTRCPLAQDLCATAEPPLRPFGAGHVAACHFPLRTPAAVANGREPTSIA